MVLELCEEGALNGRHALEAVLCDDAENIRFHQENGNLLILERIVNFSLKAKS
jgi:hypothetical protein